MVIDFRMMSSRLTRTRSWLSRSLRMDSGPADVMIEVTSHCNLSCRYCRRSEFITLPCHMDMELYQTILDRCTRHIEMAFLFGWGEPFLWPHLAEAIALARDRHIQTDITTNAAYEFTDSIRNVIEAGPDLLIIALDSDKPDIYEKYRTGAFFHETVSTAGRIIEYCRHWRPDTTVILQMIRWPEMIGFEEDYRVFARSLGVTETAIRRSFSNNGAQHAIIPEEKRRPCPVLWHGPAYIRADGSVYPCCLLNTDQIGNIEKDGWLRFWNSDRMQYLRHRHSSGDLSDLPECRKCYHTSQHGYPSVYAVAGCLSGGVTARRWMFRIDRLSRRLQRFFN